MRAGWPGKAKASSPWWGKKSDKPSGANFMLLWKHCPVISEIVNWPVRLTLRRNQHESVYRQKKRLGIMAQLY
jgi:hypothetical protein